METLNLIKNDPWLEPYADAINGRHKHASEKEAELTNKGKQTLSDFASGYLYFGLHRTDNGWVFREWAPNATQIFLIGTFNDWKEEKKYSGSKTRNYFTAYLLASIQGRRLRYLEKQQKILFAEENLEDKEITDIDISLEERLELEKKEQLLLDESKGIYPEWNEMTDINLMEAMFSLQEEERKLIYQHVFEERTFKEMSILNQMPEERCKGAYYWAIRKIRKRMGGKRS